MKKLLFLFFLVPSVYANTCSQTLYRVALQWHTLGKHDELTALVSLNGKQARMIIDTGSNIHATTKALRSLQVSVDRYQSKPLKPLFIPSHLAFEDGGISGLVSPQLIAPKAFTVVDLVNMQWYALQGSATNIQACLGQTYLGWKVYHSPWHNKRWHVLDIDAQISPYSVMPFLIDTGAKTTTAESVYMKNEAAPSSDHLLPSQLIQGSITSYPLKNRTLQLGKHAFSLPFLMVAKNLETASGGRPPGMKFSAGLIGTDILRQTAIIIPPHNSHLPISLYIHQDNNHAH